MTGFETDDSGVQNRKMSKLLKALKRVQDSSSPSWQQTYLWEALAKPLERRRAPRRALNSVVRVYGGAADEHPFYEDSQTISVGTLGARLVLSIHVSEGQKLLLINEAAQRTQVCRVVNRRCRDAETFEVGVEF